MKTVGEEIQNNPELLLNEEVDLNWTTSMNYSDEAATEYCESLCDEYEQLDVYTEKEAEHLSKMIDSLFLEKKENYWACKARFNALASRLPKKTSTSKKEVTSQYPITLEQLPDHLYSMDSTHDLFNVGRVAREWMMDQLRDDGQVTFPDESAVLKAVAYVLASYEKLWSNFTSIQSYDEWQSIMTELGLETSHQTPSLYEHFIVGQPWNSLTTYQSSLKNELLERHFKNSEEITTHSIPTNSFMKGLYPSQWLKIKQ